MGHVGAPLEALTAQLRAVRPIARRPPGPDAHPGERAEWAEASQAYDALLLRAAVMLDVPIGDATPFAPPVLSEQQRDLLEADLASAGLDVTS